MTVLVVALGAAVGAPTRYLVDLFVQSRHSSSLPWGTITVNAIGSFVIGFICRKCGQPRCPSGHCGCTSKTQKTCLECFLQKHSNQFAPNSNTCLECAS